MFIVADLVSLTTYFNINYINTCMYTLPFAHFLDCQISEMNNARRFCLEQEMHTFSGETTSVCGFNT